MGVNAANGHVAVDMPDPGMAIPQVRDCCEPEDDRPAVFFGQSMSIVDARNFVTGVERLRPLKDRLHACRIRVRKCAVQALPNPIGGGGWPRPASAAIAGGPQSQPVSFLLFS